MAAHSSAYPLSRGDAASARLNLQHFLQTKDVGYLVHPKIQLPTEDIKIADVGTGTGVWLIDLADHVPDSVQLDALDIDTSQCPPREWLPANVSVESLDVFQEVPARFIEKYNLIHIRYFACVVHNNDPASILRNVLRMLKPGGYLQWSEQDYGSQNIVAANESITTEPFITAKEEFESQSEFKINAFNWISNLDQTFREHGLDKVHVDRHRECPQFRSYWQHTYMMVLREISYSLRDGEKVRGLIQRTQNQTPEGVFWMRGHLVHIGRKPCDGEK